MKVLLEVRHGRPATAEFGERLIRTLEKAGGSVVVGTEKPDLVIAVGGDGTVLAAVQIALTNDVPVLGFNLGTFGFLAAAEADELDDVVRRLVAGDYRIDPRMTLEATLGDKTANGVNDVVIEKIDTTRLVSLSVMVDGEAFTTYRADGLILATPTGSTAYSFSAGGPLVAPGVDAIVVTPVAAHSLFDRAMVLPGDVRIDITPTGDRAVRVNVDKSDLGVLGENTLTVRRGPKPVMFVDLDRRSFSGLVRSKFGLN